MSDADALAERMATYPSAVEVGVGRRPDLAAALTARGVRVTATDLEPRPVPDGVAFSVDDVTDPDLSVYDGVALVYARHLPPELHAAVRDLAEAVGADCWFTTLGGDPPAVPTEPETVRTETGTRTLHWAVRDGAPTAPDGRS